MFAAKSKHRPASKVKNSDFGQFYKTFYGRNLFRRVASPEVCPCQPQLGVQNVFFFHKTSQS
jgi:hypothetical protein